jgi:hypothetical protein
MVIERYTGIRYVVPLREGGSLPAVVETERGGAYVVKFRGAGQGPKALIAELLVAGIADTLGLPVPRPAVIDLGEGFGKSEPDPEIQDILRGSSGANFGLAYLPGALAFDAACDRDDVTPQLAAEIVWLDAYTSNVDRTARNTNMLLWGGRIWLIDHGATLFFHHTWKDWRARAHAPFPQIKDHVLLHSTTAEQIEAADARLRPRLTDEAIRQIVAAVPDEWLVLGSPFADPTEHRAAYVRYLSERLHSPRPWLEEAIDAQRRGPERLAVRATHRVGPEPDVV